MEPEAVELRESILGKRRAEVQASECSPVVRKILKKSDLDQLELSETER